MGDVDLNVHENTTNKDNSNEAESGKLAKRICHIKGMGTNWRGRSQDKTRLACRGVR